MVGIVVDTPGQNAAMVEKLDLPFPILSDPDRDLAIRPYELADDKDPRNIAIPAVVLIRPDGEEAMRIVSRDFADRPTEDDVVTAVKMLRLPAAEQEPPRLGLLEPGPRALAVDGLVPYFRAAKFALIALGLRRPDVKEDADAFIAQLDRHGEAIVDLYRRKYKDG